MTQAAGEHDTSSHAVDGAATTVAPASGGTAAAKGSGVSQLRTMLAHGDPPIDDVVSVIRAHPSEQQAMFGLLHQSRGNSYVQKVVAATSDANHAQSEQEQISTALTDSVSKFRLQVDHEQAFHLQIKAARDKQGVVGGAEEDLEAGEEKIVHLWHAVWKEKQKTYLSAHVTVPDPKIWQKVYAKLDQANAAAVRYSHSHSSADIDQVRDRLTEAQHEYAQAHDLVSEYVGRLKSGAQALAVVATCVVVVATIATGGLAAAAGAGLLGIAATTSVVTFGMDVGIGALENKTGVTKLRGGDESMTNLLKQSGIDAATSFVGILAGGALSKLFMKGISAAIARALGRDAPVVMEKLGIASTSEIAEKLLPPLAKWFVAAGANAATAPLTTAIQIVLSGATSTMTTKQFCDLVVDNAVQQGIVNAFVSMVTHGYTAAKPTLHGTAKVAGGHVSGTVTSDGGTVAKGDVGVTGSDGTVHGTTVTETGSIVKGGTSVSEQGSVTGGKVTGDVKGSVDTKVGGAQVDGSGDASFDGSAVTASENAKIAIAIKNGSITADEAAAFKAGKLTGDAKVAFEKKIGNVTASGDGSVTVDGTGVSATQDAQIAVAIKNGSITADEAAAFKAGKLTGDAKVAFEKKIGNTTVTADGSVTVDGTGVSATQDAQIAVAIKNGSITADEAAAFKAGKLTGDAKIAFEKKIGNATVTADGSVTVDGTGVSATQDAQIAVAIKNGTITADEAAAFKAGKLTGDAKVAFEKKIGNATVTADGGVTVDGTGVSATQDAQIAVAIKNGTITADEAAAFKAGKLTGDAKVAFEKKIGNATVTADADLSLAAGKITGTEDAKLQMLVKGGQVTAEQAAKFVDGSLSADESVSIQKQMGSLTLTAEQTASFNQGKLSLAEKVQVLKLLKSGQVKASEVVDYQNGKLNVQQEAEFEAKCKSVQVTAGDIVSYENGVLNADVFVKLVEQTGTSRITEAVDAGVTVDGKKVTPHVDIEAGQHLESGKGGVGIKEELSPGGIDSYIGFRAGKFHLQGVFRGLTLREIDCSIDGHDVLNSILKVIGGAPTRIAADVKYVHGLVKFVAKHLALFEAEFQKLGLDPKNAQGTDDSAAFFGMVTALTPEDTASLEQVGLFKPDGSIDRTLSLQSVISKLAASTLDADQRAAITAEYTAGS